MNFYVKSPDFSKLATDSNSFGTLCLAKPNMAAGRLLPRRLLAGPGRDHVEGAEMGVEGAAGKQDGLVGLWARLSSLGLPHDSESPGRRA